jgi:hypothetical protein
LYGGNIGNKGAVIVANELKACKTLKEIGINHEIGLDYNHIGDSGMLAISAALKGNTILTSISIYLN